MGDRVASVRLGSAPVLPADRGAPLAFVSGVLFAAGLALSGMARPDKVLGFLDLAGDWDPSLLLVMAGAIPVHAVGWWLLGRRPIPAVPRPARRVDTRLVTGAVLFGVGWGLAGVCPGPALVNLASGPAALGFVVAMCAGVVLTSVRRPVPEPA